MTTHRRNALALALGWMIVAAAAGCGGKPIEITQYPRFYDPRNPATHVKTIAIVPFRNQAPQAKAQTAGQAISEELASALGGTGTYGQVYNRAALVDMLNEQDLKIAMGGDAESMSAVFKKVANVEAVLTGAVTGYSSSTRTFPKIDQIPQWNPRTKRMVMIQRKRIVTRNEATVTLTAALTRASSGVSIYSTAPITRRAASEGSPAPLDVNACLSRARSTAVRALTEQFGIVRKTIKVPGGAFKTASGVFDGKWKHTGKFKVSDPKLYVVLKLPDVCAENIFQIKIARRKQEANLASQVITWKPGHSKVGRGIEFSPRQLGVGKYVAKFYPGPGGNVQPKLFAKFEVKP